MTDRFKYVFCEPTGTEPNRGFPESLEFQALQGSQQRVAEILLNLCEALKSFLVSRSALTTYVGPRGQVFLKFQATQFGNRDDGKRRLTRDSRNRRLTRDSRIPDFSCKNLWKNRKNRFFGLRGPKSNFVIFMIFYTTSISYINPLFRAPSPPKPLKLRPGGQNLPGDPLTAQSDHRGPVSAQFYGLCCLFLTLSHFKLAYFKLNK